MSDDDTEGGDDLEASTGIDVATAPNEAADTQSIVDAKIPKDIRKKFEILSYRNAAVILSESRQVEFNELLQALRSFSISSEMIRKAGGNESDIPKLLSASLRPRGWHETIIQGDLLVRLTWREQVGTTKKGKPKYETRFRELKRNRHLDGHKIDYVKDRVAFDMEWNSKDQTFDRDLYAFNAFFLSGAIDVGVLLTRGASLTPALRQLGQALKRNGEPEFKVIDGHQTPRMTHEKY